MIWILFAIICAGILTIFYHYKEKALFFLIFLAPFTGFVFDFSRNSWLRELPYIGRVQAPVADFVALFLLGAVILKILSGFWQGKTRVKNLKIYLEQTGFYYFLPFLFAGLISLFSVSSEQLTGSFKYLLRPIFFSFLIWLLLPYFLIDAEKTFKKSLKIFWAAAIVASIFSWITSLISALSILPNRLTPGSLFGLAPLTYNHNVLAEFLVSAVPLAFFYFIDQNLKSKKTRKWFFLSFVLITLTALLTFSRAAWISLAIQLALYFFITRNENSPRQPTEKFSQKNWKQFITVGLALLPFIVYLGVFSFSSIATSSNTTRWDMTRIAWTYFSEHQWIGNGAGTFLVLLADTQVFTVEYGDPLDAHGLVQKIMAEEGLLGLITFFFFALWLIKTLYRGLSQAKNSWGYKLELMLFLSVAGSLTFQLFNTSYYSPHLWLPIGLALAGRKIFSYVE